MPIYTPIDTGIPMECVGSDLVAFDWSVHGIKADFILPHDESHLIRVSFDSECIVRILDEMALSIEEDDGPSEGLVANNFAYRLEGAAFVRMQSAAWKELRGPVTHYQFVTGWACLDVLTAATPQFTLVPFSPEE